MRVALHPCDPIVRSRVLALCGGARAGGGEHGRLSPSIRVQQHRLTPYAHTHIRGKAEARWLGLAHLMRGEWGVSKNLP